MDMAQEWTVLPALIGKAGEALATAELMRRGVVVAAPAYDRGIDFLAYRADHFDLPIRVVPVQVKARSGTVYNFKKSWFSIGAIALVQIWNAYTNPEFYVFSTLAEMEEALGEHAKSDSWVKDGGFSATAPSKSDLALMVPHRDRWDRILRQLNTIAD
jgi:hypothetical protein